jgi:hypothetical protein
MALIEAAWAATTVALNMRQSKNVREWIGSLLTTCNPRATEFKVYVATRRRKPAYYYYYIGYSCKSHVNDDLRMDVKLDKYKDKPDIHLGFIP